MSNTARAPAASLSPMRPEKSGGGRGHRLPNRATRVERRLEQQWVSTGSVRVHHFDLVAVATKCHVECDLGSVRRPRWKHRCQTRSGAVEQGLPPSPVCTDHPGSCGRPRKRSRSRGTNSTSPPRYRTATRRARPCCEPTPVSADSTGAAPETAPIAAGSRSASRRSRKRALGPGCRLHFSHAQGSRRAGRVPVPRGLYRHQQRRSPTVTPSWRSSGCGGPVVRRQRRATSNRPAVRDGRLVRSEPLRLAEPRLPHRVMAPRHACSGRVHGQREGPNVCPCDPRRRASSLVLPIDLRSKRDATD